MLVITWRASDRASTSSGKVNGPARADPARATNFLLQKITYQKLIRLFLVTVIEGTYFRPVLVVSAKAAGIDAKV